MMATSAKTFHMAMTIRIKLSSKLYIETASSNIKIKIPQLFSKQWIFGVHVTILQRKISGDLTRTCISITFRP